jgi:hypothetical protein
MSKLFNFDFSFNFAYSWLGTRGKINWATTFLTEGSLWSSTGYSHSIDAHAASVDALRHLHTFTPIFGPEADAQSIFGVIAHANRFFFTSRW